MVINMSYGGAESKQARVIFWLNNIDIKQLTQSPFEYVIIDYSRDGSQSGEFSTDEISNLKNSLPSGRMVLAYMSIGEAENYRFYWQDWWKPDPDPPSWKGIPKFLGPENKTWNGNYLVDYRNKDWEKIIFSYIDKIINQGFDGIFIDKIDSYINLEEKPYYIKNSRKKIEKLAAKISLYAKNKRKGFKIIANNAEELALEKNSALENESYLNAIDGIVKESLFIYNGKIRGKKEINNTIKLLKIFKKNQKTVFIIEYPDLNNKKLINWIYEQSYKNGFLPYCGPVELNAIITN